MRRFVMPLCVALVALAAGAGAAAAESLTMSIPQSRVFAAQALQQGRPTVALSVARGVLTQAPGDVAMLMVASQAEGMLGLPKAALRDARAAFRHAATKEQRFAAAILIARALAADQHDMRSQLWLRRALDLAPTPAARQATSQLFARVRDGAPFHLGFSVSASPSTNLNGGAAGALLVISGQPYVGVLSGSAQALSGWQETATLTFDWRVSGTARQQTQVGGRLYGLANQLSPAAAALAPGVKGSDFNVGQAEAFVKRTWRVGQGGDVESATLTAGRTWYGGDPYDRHLRLDLLHTHPLSQDDTLRLGVSGGLQWQTLGPQTQALSLGGDWAHRLAAGDTAVVSVGLTRQASADAQQAYAGQWLRLGYSFGRPIGPVNLSLTLSVGRNHYADYSVIFPVPGGRSDRFVSAGVTLGLDRPEWLGFAPVLTLNATHTQSNVSRFTTSAVSLGLGVRSVF